MKALGLLPFFIFLLSISSCNEAKKAINLASDLQLTGSYVILSLRGEVLHTIDAKKVLISFNSSDNTITGNTGCNSYFGNYHATQYELSFSDIGQTEMACEEDVMKIEWDFIQALRDTGSFTLEKNRLTVYSISDRIILLTAKKEVKGETDNDN